MFAFLFDRRSGLKTTVLVTALALFLFGGGVLVGLNLRWSREEVANAIANPLSLRAAAEEEAGALAPGAKPAPKVGAAPQGGAAEGGGDTAAEPGAPPAGDGDPGAGGNPPEGWVPMTPNGRPAGPTT